MKQHLKFYKDVINNGNILPKIECANGLPYQLDGLCECAEYNLIDRKILSLFHPSNEEFNDLRNERCSILYWADGINNNNNNNALERTAILTPLRQNIILFMAAINNEL